MQSSKEWQRVICRDRDKKCIWIMINNILVKKIFLQPLKNYLFWILFILIHINIHLLLEILKSMLELRGKIIIKVRIWLLLNIWVLILMMMPSLRNLFKEWNKKKFKKLKEWNLLKLLVVSTSHREHLSW